MVIYLTLYFIIGILYSTTISRLKISYSKRLLRLYYLDIVKDIFLWPVMYITRLKNKRDNNG
jgi:hypothetical protein